MPVKLRGLSQHEETLQRSAKQRKVQRKLKQQNGNIPGKWTEMSYRDRLLGSGGAKI